MEGAFCTTGGRLSIKVDSAVVSDSFSSTPHEIFHKALLLLLLSCLSLLLLLLLLLSSLVVDVAGDGGKGGLSTVRLSVGMPRGFKVGERGTEDCRVVALGDAVDEGMELEE